MRTMLKSHASLTARSWSGHSDVTMRRSIRPLRAGREGRRAARRGFHRLLGEPLPGGRGERPRRQVITVDRRRPHPVEPAVLDRVHPVPVRPMTNAGEGPPTVRQVEATASADRVVVRGGEREVRGLLRVVGAQAVGPRGRAPGVHERARAGAPGRRAGLPLRVGRRAPLPRGVLALVGARAVPHGVRHADQEHPRRPRHRRVRPAVQPPGPRRRAGRRARHPLRRPARVRHRSVGDVDRARRLPRRSRHDRRRRGTSTSTRSRRCG